MDGSSVKSVRVQSTDGCVIELRDLGGAGPDLIISHATGFHGAAYQPMAESLRQHFRVWALDFRGHGASSPPASGDFAWAGMAEDLLSCIRIIGVESILAFGHSLGGAVTLLAERATPGLIRAAYLFEPIVFPRDLRAEQEGDVMSGPARRRREMFASKADALSHYAANTPLGVFRADALAAYVEHGFDELDDGTVQLRCRAESEARTFECDQKMVIEQLEGMDLSVTVARGTAEPLSGPATLAPGVASALENGQLVTHDHIGHFGPFEAPDLIAADVIAALARI